MPSDHKEETEDSLDELFSVGVGSSTGVQKKCHHSGGSLGDSDMIVVEDKEMVVCLVVMRDVMGVMWYFWT
jgi:hypothetical protein